MLHQTLQAGPVEGSLGKLHARAQWQRQAAHVHVRDHLSLGNVECVAQRADQADADHRRDVPREPKGLRQRAAEAGHERMLSPEANAIDLVEVGRVGRLEDRRRAPQVEQPRLRAGGRFQLDVALRRQRAVSLGGIDAGGKQLVWLEGWQIGMVAHEHALASRYAGG